MGKNVENVELMPHVQGTVVVDWRLSIHHEDGGQPLTTFGPMQGWDGVEDAADNPQVTAQQWSALLAGTIPGWAPYAAAWDQPVRDAFTAL